MDEDGTLKRLLHPNETMSMVAPLPEALYVCPCCNKTVTCHTPVPAQIEAAAKRVLPLLPAKVCGNGWLSTSGDFDEAEAAQEKYSFDSDYSTYFEEDSDDKEDEEN